ncbi:MAG TPA: hypothetical protein VEQ63_14185 [Bryobacteraceae bacterium]|nr:hypothetical protein [Bryobacteraceae bacterium]
MKLEHVFRTLPLVLAATVLVADEPHALDGKLPVSTIVREDIFAGWLANDMTRLERAAKRLEQLLQERPAAKSEIFSWQGAIAGYRAARAYAAKEPADVEKQLGIAERLFEQAREAGRSDLVAYLAIRGGTYTLVGERLPEPVRSESWKIAYQSLSQLEQIQAPFFDKMPVHHRGEVLSGLAVAAQRLGKTEEQNKYVDKVLATLPSTPYATIAAKWKANPEIAGRTSMACQTCHDAGTLQSRRAALLKAAVQ